MSENMPKRVIENGTMINLCFGETVIPALLNSTKTALAFADKLPATIRVNGTGVDFCGRIPFDLPYENEQVHNGWLNGDIDYNPEGGWFALLYGGEEESAAYDDQVTIGVIDCPLGDVARLSGSFDLVVELAE